MLDFIWHLRGSVVLKDLEPDDVVLDRIEHLLTRQRKTLKARGRNDLAFEDPLWSSFGEPSWLAMVIYDQGRFWIERASDRRILHYDLRSLHALVFCAFLPSVAFLAGSGSEGFVTGMKLSVAALAWLYGMNVLLALLRVPLAIRKAIRRG